MVHNLTYESGSKTKTQHLVLYIVGPSHKVTEPPQYKANVWVPIVYATMPVPPPKGATCRGSIISFGTCKSLIFFYFTVHILI